MDLVSLPTTSLETDIKLEGTYLIHNSRPTMELRSSTHEVIEGIPPETTHPTLVVDDRLIDIRNSPLDGKTTMITGPTTPEPRQEEPGRTLKPIHVLLLVRDEIHRKVDSISPRGPSAPDNSVFRRSNSQDSSGFVPYEQRFPRTNDQSGSHTVRFTTTDDSINALSDLCPLN